MAIFTQAYSASAYSSYGPYSARAKFEITDGDVVISTVAPLDANQGFVLLPDQQFVLEAGQTAYIRARSAGGATFETSTATRDESSQSNLLLSGPAAQFALNTDLLTGVVSGYLDVSQYSTVTVQLNGSAGISAGSVFFEQSVDGVNFKPLIVTEITVISANPLVAAVAIAAGVQRLFLLQPTVPYIRCRISVAFTGGTIQAFAHLRQKTVDLPSINVQQAAAGSLLMINMANLFYNETTTAQAANATFTGATRDVGGAAAAAVRAAMFNAIAVADQAGLMRIEFSNDNTNWYRGTTDTAVAANTPVILSIPVCTRYHRVVYVNGGTLQGSFVANTSYTAA